MYVFLKKMNYFRIVTLNRLKTQKNYLLLLILFQLLCLFIYYKVSLKSLTNYSSFICKKLFQNKNDNILNVIISQQDKYVNCLCEKPSIEYDDALIYDQVEQDRRSLKSAYNSCTTDLKFENYIKIIKNDSIYFNEIFMLKLNISLIRNFDSKSKCSFQRFDKQMNKTESLETSVVKNEFYEFNQINNYTINVDNFGYYYLNCTNTTNQTIFDYVYNIMPTDMTKLIDQRNEYKILTNMQINEYKIDTKLKLKMYENNYNNRKKECNLNIKLNHQKMNVLMIGIDSLSHDQFALIFPMTYLYLRDHLKDNLIFKRFNNNGENTYPNMLSLLTGITIYNMTEYNITSDLEFYLKNDDTYHDTFPFVWNDYEDLGYLTMYNEDQPSISLFNYIKNGFRFCPTGFYARPFWSKYYNIRTGPNNCHRKYHTFSTWLNLLDSFIQNMNTDTNKNLNYFSFNYLNEYTHDNMYVPHDLDVQLRDMIVRFEKNGNLDNTFLMIFSDHGVRLRNYGFDTDQGRMEKNNPFISIRLPKSFKNTRYFKNAFENQFKLVTFFDLFQTFKHFLHINKYGIENDNHECNKEFTINDINDRNKRGISIFENIHVNRSCIDGLIPYLYCNCLTRKKLNRKDFELETDYKFEFIKSSIVEFLNEITEPEREKCELFTFDQLKSIENLKFAEINVYMVNLVVQPGNAWFEVSIKVDENFRKEYNKTKLAIYTYPKRLSRYGDQSHCVKNHPVLVNFCFCKF